MARLCLREDKAFITPTRYSRQREVKVHVGGAQGPESARFLVAMDQSKKGNATRREGQPSGDEHGDEEERDPIATPNFTTPRLLPSKRQRSVERKTAQCPDSTSNARRDSITAFHSASQVVQSRDMRLDTVNRNGERSLTASPEQFDAGTRRRISLGGCSVQKAPKLRDDAAFSTSDSRGLLSGHAPLTVETEMISHLETVQTSENPKDVDGTRMHPNASPAEIFAPLSQSVPESGQPLSPRSEELPSTVAEGAFLLPEAECLSVAPSPSPRVTPPPEQLASLIIPESAGLLSGHAPLTVETESASKTEIAKANGNAHDMEAAPSPPNACTEDILAPPTRSFPEPEQTLPHNGAQRALHLSQAEGLLPAPMSTPRDVTPFEQMVSGSIAESAGLLSGHAPLTVETEMGPYVETGRLSENPCELYTTSLPLQLASEERNAPPPHSPRVTEQPPSQPIMPQSVAEARREAPKAKDLTLSPSPRVSTPSYQPTWQTTPNLHHEGRIPSPPRIFCHPSAGSGSELTECVAGRSGATTGSDSQRLHNNADPSLFHSREVTGDVTARTGENALPTRADESQGSRCNVAVVTSNAIAARDRADNNGAGTGGPRVGRAVHWGVVERDVRTTSPSEDSTEPPPSDGDARGEDEDEGEEEDSDVEPEHGVILGINGIGSRALALAAPGGALVSPSASEGSSSNDGE